MLNKDEAVEALKKRNIDMNVRIFKMQFDFLFYSGILDRNSFKDVDLVSFMSPMFEKNTEEFKQLKKFLIKNQKGVE